MNYRQSTGSQHRALKASHLCQRVTKRVALGRERKMGLALARTTNRKVPAAFPQAPVLTVSMLFSNAI